MALETLINKSHVAECVRRWGGAASVGILDPACKIFSDPEIDGVIGYRDGSSAVVVFGDPACAPTDLLRLVTAFHQFCHQNGKNIVYMTTSEWFASFAIKEKLCGALLEVGEELIVDPFKSDPKEREGSDARLVRKKVNHATRDGVVIKEYTGHDTEFEARLQSVGKSWLDGRSGPQIYMACLDLFEERVGKRWFYAEQGDRIVGLCLLHELEARQGWLIHFLFAIPDAPVGTTELLLVKVLEGLKGEGCRFASFGTAVREQLGEVSGLNPISSWVARSGFNAAVRYFQLAGRRVFWKKFEPESVGSYLLFSESRVGLKEIMGIMRAFNATAK